MGILVNGVWTDETLAEETGGAGDFRRKESHFRDRITADGSSGYKAETGRYHLYVAHGCPWAHRTLIYRAVKGLADAITVAYAQPHVREQGWTYERNARFPECTPDEVNGFHYLHEAYAAAEPGYTGKVTVPTLWDKKTRKIVNNESSEIIRMLNSAFRGVAGNDLDFYPVELRAEIDALNARIYETVNNGVYRCGFAKSQGAYDESYRALFETLDFLEERLSRQRYLVGDRVTEADWRLLPTLVRFDVAYFSLFKCNRQRIEDYRHLSNYTRDLVATSGVAATVFPAQYVANYYSILRCNPTGIIPGGVPVDLSRPHDRDRLFPLN